MQRGGPAYSEHPDGADQAALYSFDTELEKVQDFTSDFS